VLIKSDSYPTYHLAVVVDDHLMEITHVIPRRGMKCKILSKHMISLLDYFRLAAASFYHTPNLRNPDTFKLSKACGRTVLIGIKRKDFYPKQFLISCSDGLESRPKGRN